MIGHGTTRDAQSRFRDSIRGCLSSSTRFGTAYTNSLRSSDTKYVYGYNIEVFKRGKYRKDKHYVVYRYAFPTKSSIC